MNTGFIITLCWVDMTWPKIILILDTCYLRLKNTCLSTPNSQLQSPISLHDLYEPDPIPFHFETPGWYIVLTLLLIAVIAVLVIQIIKFRRNKYRRIAIRNIENLTTGFSLIPDLFVILKKTAIHAFGREKTGNLYGKEWIDFLESTGQDIKLSAYSEEIADILYKGKTVKSETEKKILLNAKKWVKTHACKF